VHAKNELALWSGHNCTRTHTHTHTCKCTAHVYNLALIHTHTYTHTPLHTHTSLTHSQVLHGHTGPVLCMALGGACDPTLVTGSADHTLRLWDLRFVHSHSGVWGKHPGPDRDPAGPASPGSHFGVGRPTTGGRTSRRDDSRLVFRGILHSVYLAVGHMYLLVLHAFLPGSALLSSSCVVCF
jgi:WD40 repeat protein